MTYSELPCYHLRAGRIAVLQICDADSNSALAAGWPQLWNPFKTFKKKYTNTKGSDTSLSGQQKVKFLGKSMFRIRCKSYV